MWSGGEQGQGRAHEGALEPGSDSHHLQVSHFDDTGVLQQKSSMYLVQEEEKLKEGPVGPGGAMDLAAAPCQQMWDTSENQFTFSYKNMKLTFLSRHLGWQILFLTKFQIIFT